MTHVLHVSDELGARDVKVAARNRLNLRVGGDTEGWKVSEIERVELTAMVNGRYVLEVITEGGRGFHRQLSSGAWLELILGKSDSWRAPVSSLARFQLERIPEPIEEPAPPLRGSRLTLKDGSELVLPVGSVVVRLRQPGEPGNPISGIYHPVVDLDRVESIEDIVAAPVAV
jgi:hypothetical protein